MGVIMIVTPLHCTHYKDNKNLNKTCTLKNKRCVLISEQKSCSKYAVKVDTGFWDISGQYIEDIQEISGEDL